MMGIFFIGLIVILTLMIIGGSQYQNFQLVGVVLAPDHAASPAVSDLQKRFRKEQIGIAVVFILLFLLTQTTIFQGQRDFWQLILLFVYLVVAFLPMYQLHRKLTKLKQEKGWMYQSNKRLADLSVTREKGKAAPANYWVWLIWLLSWLPLGMVAIGGQGWEAWLPALVIPIVLIVLPLTYPATIRSRTPFISEDSDVAKHYMRHFERIHGIGYIALTLSVSLFFIGIMALMLWNPQSLLVIPLTLVFLVVITAIMLITFSRSRALLKEIADIQDWQMTDSQSKFVWGFYYNSEDSRLFVPKQFTGMGTTINAAHPAGKIILVVTGILIVALIIWVLVLTLATFQINITADTLAVDVPMYSIEVPLADIEAIELVEGPLEGVRTNGYGGQDKAYGYFTMEDYGSTRWYVYPDNDWYIELLLADTYDPQWLIYNEQTFEETEAVYQQLLDAWEAQ
ncbi:DUF5808 domain-containing protein [Fundicoccus culcitae]|uniref:DUF5808 domain-containing protein n=1 Tax=Fundicoccus culcitae TaxID=2969821 RepID=A0ABY5P4V8_9LACT|nr:DUF5808 domain-containing protein [Fundicoccus culcitae]UUX33584.1 DUF5808 domain-containing protein [Fundicoccus culcitae]